MLVHLLNDRYACVCVLRPTSRNVCVCVERSASRYACVCAERPTMSLCMCLCVRDVTIAVHVFASGLLFVLVCMCFAQPSERCACVCGVERSSNRYA